jgi:rare lipoprotein A
MAAAHRTLPFGSLVEVKHAASGRRVVVRINDRGPFTATAALTCPKPRRGRSGWLGRASAGSISACCATVERPPANRLKAG